VDAVRTLLTSLSEADVRRVIAALEAECGSPRIRPGVRPMTWPMVLDMSRAGMGIGSHTRNHTLLTNEARRRAFEELAGSQQVLAEKLRRPIRSFAYPDGRFDAAVVGLVAAAGYQIAVTTCRHRDPLHPWLTVPRLLLWERSSVDGAGRFSPAILSAQLTGLFDRFSTCRQGHGGPEGVPQSHGERRGRADRFQRIVSLSGR
jgi:peptidoglycan/xylan/chitin deacetylase (PgdA/CDA1 family)